MVKLRKRLTPTEKIAEIIDPEWDRILKFPNIRSIIEYPDTSYQPFDPEYLLSTAAECRRGLLTKTKLRDKVFVYMFCFVSWRMFGVSLLSDKDYDALKNHLHTSAILSKIENGDVPLAHRQAFIWDTMVLARLYDGPCSIQVKKKPLRRVKPKKTRLRRVKNRK